MNEAQRAQDFIEAKIRSVWPLKEPEDLLHTDTNTVASLMMVAYAAGAADENEACAKIVDATTLDLIDGHTARQASYDTAQQIAEAIRARQEQRND